MNSRPPGYELLPVAQSIGFRHFPTLFVPEICQIPEVIWFPLRRDFSCSGSGYYVVTEYGIAPLKGRTLRQRARNLIAIAHPDIRDELKAEFERRFHQKY